MHDGGLCATARDMARFGQLLLDGELSPTGPGAPAASYRRAGSVTGGPWTPTSGGVRRLAGRGSFPGGWYRNQFWFRPGAYGDVLLGLGVSTARCCTSAGAPTR